MAAPYPVPLLTRLAQLGGPPNLSTPATPVGTIGIPTMAQPPRESLTEASRPIASVLSRSCLSVSWQRHGP